MTKTFLRITLLHLLSVSLHAQQTEDKIYHYSSMDAMRNGVYTGDVTVKELRQKGDFGLGTYNFLDGELISLDGNIFRIATDGSVEVADDQRKVPFGSFTFFRKDQAFVMEHISTFADFQQKLLKILPSRNRFYAVKVEAYFTSITLGGAIKVDEKDTTGIASFMKARPLYKKRNITGTLVGFYNPGYAGGLDLSPFHFHFISDDKKSGGHMVEGSFSNTKITVQLDEKNAYEVILPDSNDEGNQRTWTTSEAKAQY